MSASERKKCVLIRLDKIGDLVATLPCDEHPFLSQYDCHWIISKGLEFIPEARLSTTQFLSLSKDFSGFLALYQYLKSNPFSIAISFQSPWWVNFLLFYFRVNERIGVLSKWHSFLFLNKGIRQRRSESIKHEGDYNFDLITQALKKNVSNTSEAQSTAGKKTPTLKLKANSNPRLLEKWGLTPKAFMIVHPGMAGSSLNWPQEKYSEFLIQFSKNNPMVTLVVTGTQQDMPFLNQVLTTLNQYPGIKNTIGQLSTQELLSLLSEAVCVLAPSTGVLHLAASLGTPTISIFSPIQVQSVTRWGPRGNLSRVLTPDVKCPAIHSCLGKSCSYFYCMDHLDVLEKVMAAVKDDVQRAKQIQT